jgi:TPR repeat protein
VSAAGTGGCSAGAELEDVGRTKAYWAVWSATELSEEALYKLSADQGNARGQNNLGVFYRDGRGGLTKDDREAARLYKLSADQGDAYGQANLGVFYRDGQGGLTKHDREAARLYKLAADQGNDYAIKALQRLNAGR